jgi:NitT/TauT family transport system substrate-binding protein
MSRCFHFFFFKAVVAAALIAGTGAFSPAGAITPQSTIPDKKRPAVVRVTLCLQWVHQAQFAGFYVAQDQGIFRRHGLAVTILPGGPGIDPLGELARGRCHFAMTWLIEGVARRSQGQGIVHLAQLIQRSSLLLVAFKKKGIRKLSDLAGRRVGLWPPPFAWPVRALFARQGIAVREVVQGISMEPFLRGAVRAATATFYNEYHRLFQAGVNPGELTVWRLADLGLDLPEDGLYARTDLWRSRPQVARRFVAAALAGWRRAAAHPDQALKSVMRRVGRGLEPSNLSHQRWMLQKMLELIRPRQGDGTLGRLNRAALQSVNRVLVERGVIGRPISAAGFLTGAWK